MSDLFVYQKLRHHKLGGDLLSSDPEKARDQLCGANDIRHRLSLLPFAILRSSTIITVFTMRWALGSIPNSAQRRLCFLHLLLVLLFGLRLRSLHLTFCPTLLYFRFLLRGAILLVALSSVFSKPFKSLVLFSVFRFARVLGPLRFIGEPCRLLRRQSGAVWPFVRLFFFGGVSSASGPSDLLRFQVLLLVFVFVSLGFTLERSWEAGFFFFG